MVLGAALASVRRKHRAALSFRDVNRSDAPDYDPGLQRHHLLPRQLLSQRCFGPLFDLIGRERVGFDDFRTNGLLLPSRESSAVRVGLPLHRGPHRRYNKMVIERVGQVEQRWSILRLKAPEIALQEALERLGLLQRALRRRLLWPRNRPFQLNRADVLGRDADFSEVDAMIDSLWPATEEAAAEAPGAGSDRFAANPDEASLIRPVVSDGLWSEAVNGAADLPAFRF
ncbi:hypothetical protein GTZ99_07305 [Novosphingobium sp. FSY-8]|uniref:HNH endonuclease n=2 Tax=Novosphingobium ovatum TaxID=1908523 RepID=A0ABW9XCU3_9SPHN|nr:hypothetical protein [Novosphingobium ovatum]